MTLVVPKAVRESLTVIIDAGIEHIRIDIRDAKNAIVRQAVLANNDTIASVFRRHGINTVLDAAEVVHKDIYITGKLADIVHAALGTGYAIMPGAAMWQAARMLVRKRGNRPYKSLGIVELSASGYTIVCIDRQGRLKDDLLVTNPHCGAGSGINLNRVLQKLDIPREDVDDILRRYLGNGGREKRDQITARADRCGVFSSSATVSDKNQGIPLDFALATTIKSEVLKACKKIGDAAQKVYLTGGIFRWQYARDCAHDFFMASGKVKAIEYDDEQSIPIRGTRDLIESVGADYFRKQEPPLVQARALEEYPAFSDLKKKFESTDLYHRIPDRKLPGLGAHPESRPVNMSLDVGSTMAKVVISEAGTNAALWMASYNNHGDTIETIKHIFRELKADGIRSLNLQNIGITGSGRYQVQRVLSQVYPHLDGRVRVLVENYAHARGSIAEARTRIRELKQAGRPVNEELAVLVDVGGEDTKISIVSLPDEDLLDNAMNIKCSAGTGSLMDTLKTLFGIESIEEACRQAQDALKGYNINATCAVFLMENASKMRAEGYPTDEIMASCYWAIVENMARTLWSQVKMPNRPLVLLHGQTMLSDPLPLAVTHRMQTLTDSVAYGLVPEAPGHRACIGLLKSIPENDTPIAASSVLDDLIERKFEKKIITCRGAACGDKSSRCNRVKLTFHAQGQKPEHIQLGGCSAVNELMSRIKDKSGREKPVDTYKEIWQYIDTRLPRTDHADRIIIPRSFAASEQAPLLAGILENLGLPVHIDNIVAGDVSRGQRFFDLDACAPNIGATGQLQRLASAPHGLILVPQIDHLPTEGVSVGRTCTVNQGGCIIAMRFAQQEYPQARLQAFSLSLKEMDAAEIAGQLRPQWTSLLERYNCTPSAADFLAAVESALERVRVLNDGIADQVADYLALAIDKGQDIAIACGREYVLNPGVFDSHIGRLFRDKGVLAIPSHVFDIELEQQFESIYWRNPHHIASIVNAVKDKQLHTIIKHPRMAAMIQRIESGQTQSLIGLSMVSTFSCGPDSIALPLLQELTKTMPFILVQSDGAIQELAHLENRVNTYLKQLTVQTQKALDDNDFRIELLDEFALDKLDKKTDVLYFPTLGDNRVITSIIRAAGFTCIDNYDDETYDPEKAIRMGRVFIGDSICAPFAGVFGDTLRAIEDFTRRKRLGQFSDKHRVMCFNNRGRGPCRQGQYSDLHRLLLHREKSKQGGAERQPAATLNETSVRYMVALESENFDFGIPEWVLVQSFQGVVIQGIFHSLYLTAGAACRNRFEFMEFQRDFARLKGKVLSRMEKGAPSARARAAVKAAEGLDWATGLIARVVPGLHSGTRLAAVAKYFGYGLHNNNGLRRYFRAFARKWIKPGKNSTVKLKIHSDGEGYIRISLLKKLFHNLIDSMGFNNFELTSNPLWSYLEYLPQETIIELKNKIKLARSKLAFKPNWRTRRALKKEIRAHRREIRRVKKAVKLLRTVLAAPLYKAANIEIPHPVRHALGKAREVLPTGKPYGELLPYVGESLVQLEEGADLILNMAPAGCMVATMGGVLHPIIRQYSPDGCGQLQTILSQNGEIDAETVAFALLKQTGPTGYYIDNRESEDSEAMSMQEEMAA